MVKKMTTKLNPNQEYINWLIKVNRKEGGLLNKTMLAKTLGITLGGATNKVNRDQTFKLIKFNEKDKGHISLNEVLDYLEKEV